MDNFTLSRYAYPALSDLATVRVPIDKAAQAEEWIQSQNAQVLQSKPTIESRMRFDPAINDRVEQRTPVQAITFQDNSTNTGLIDHLLGRPNVEEVLYRYRGKDATELSPVAYDTLNQLKFDAAPPDYLTKLGLRLPQHLEDPFNGEWERLAYDSSINSPEYNAQGNYAFSRLQNFAEQQGIPVKRLDPEEFLNAYNRESAKQIDLERAKYVNGFASITAPSGRTRGIYIQNKPDTPTLKFAGTLAHELGHALSMPAHTVAGTFGKQGIVNSTSDRIAEIHAEPIGYGLLRQVLPDSEMAKKVHYLRSLNFLGGNVPNSYSGSYGPTGNVIEYFNSPDLQNQIRNTVKFAGQLLA
ncbi:hypothetical protein [Nodosilinea nodulosa]|uniref:hypothetical protein n=1 Tax=Nodosilinea nodulosa TaxID=416001 RepID=UPI0002DB798E|nr:hypothetical protein [Nodosilinea nodulosa]